MKRCITMMLVFAMCLSLCACGKSEAVKNVESLIEAIGGVTVDSEAAVVAAEKAYNSLSEEDKSTVENAFVLESARESLDALLFERAILGTWISINSGASYTFMENGECIYTDSDNNSSLTYEITEQTIRVTTAISKLVFNLEEDSRSVVHMIDETSGIDCVSESDYSAFAPEEIEITLDNWQNYFEIRPANRTECDAFGTIIHYVYGYAFFLKDEYMDRVASISDIAFKVNAAFEYRQVEWDTQQLIEGGKIGETEVAEVVATIADYRDNTISQGHSDLDGYIAAYIPDIGGYGDFNLYWSFYTDEFDVIDVKGTLELAP